MPVLPLALDGVVVTPKRKVCEIDPEEHKGSGLGSLCPVAALVERGDLDSTQL